MDLCRVILFNKADYGRCAQHFPLVDKNKQAASRQTYCNGVPQGPASDGQKQKHQQVSSDLVGFSSFPSLKSRAICILSYIQQDVLVKYENRMKKKAFLTSPLDARCGKRQRASGTGGRL